MCSCVLACVFMCAYKGGGACLYMRACVLVCAGFCVSVCLSVLFGVRARVGAGVCTLVRACGNVLVFSRSLQIPSFMSISTVMECLEQRQSELSLAPSGPFHARHGIPVSVPTIQNQTCSSVPAAVYWMCTAASQEQSNRAATPQNRSLPS